MNKAIKLLRPEQAKDISDTILKLASMAYMQGQITQEECDGIVTFTAEMTAFVAVMDEQGLIQK